MLSFWEKKNFTHYNYIVIGSGITGLSTACAIKERQPKASVLVLERGLIPTGASTKNAGFACIGSLSEKLSDLELMGEENFLKLVEDRWIGLYLLRKRIGDINMDYQNNGGFELITHRNDFVTEQMEHMNKLLEKILKKQAFHEIPDMVNAFGFNKAFVKNIICNPFEAQIDTGLMMHSLLNYAGLLQIRVITGAQVENFVETGDHVEVNAKGILAEHTMKFTCDKLAICTNAFSKQFFPDMDIKPGRGQVVCTSPIKSLKIKGIFAFEEGYYYFRNFENRVIFGGGRNLAFDEETTTEFSFNEKIVKQLEFYLEEMILPGIPFTIEHKWSGIMAFGKEKLPIVKKVSDRVAIGARMNGMGVALGSKVADDIANMLLK